MHPVLAGTNNCPFFLAWFSANLTLIYSQSSTKSINLNTSGLPASCLFLEGVPLEPCPLANLGRLVAACTATIPRFLSAIPPGMPFSLASSWIPLPGSGSRVWAKLSRWSKQATISRIMGTRTLTVKGEWGKKKVRPERILWAGPEMVALDDHGFWHTYPHRLRNRYQMCRLYTHVWFLVLSGREAMMPAALSTANARSWSTILFTH